MRPHLDGYAVVPYQDERIREARLRLRNAASVERARIPIDTRVVPGDTTTEINRVIDTIGADVLIVGNPRRGAVSRAVFGTTAARLHRTVRVPLMAVPDAESVGQADGADPTRRLAPELGPIGVPDARKAVKSRSFIESGRSAAW